MTDTALLVPRPQRASPAEPWRLPSVVYAAPISEELLPALDAALDNFAGDLQRRGVHFEHGTQDAAHLHLSLESGFSKHGAEAYTLRIEPSGVKIVAGGPPGLYRGLTTLVQWLRLQPHRRVVDGLIVEDWPDVNRRGLMLDVSRNRMPRMKELYALVDLLSDLKLNELQLYIEHTFAYVGHEKVWRGWSPLSAGQLRRLESYANRRHVELVPNQNSFGHFHRWLVHEPYRQLAECPDGIEHPFSPHPEPFSLCPMDINSLRLLQDLYSQLLPNFRSSWFNAGLDETLDLGRCRSKQACEQRGKDRIYLDFLLRVRALAAEHHKRLMFWGDIMLEKPELVSALPADVVPMVWGYEPDHDFAASVAPFAAANLDYYVCPGTATWNSFTGRTGTALSNLSRAARDGGDAEGYLITDWGDHGHLQPPPVSWPAYTAGAAFAWNKADAERPESLPLPALLDHHVLRDEAFRAGTALCQLGTAQDLTGVRSLNGAPLFFAWFFADKPSTERRGEGLDAAGIEAAMDAFAQVQASLGQARLARPDGGLIRDELAWTVRAADLGASLAKARLTSGVETPVEALPQEVRKKLCRDLDAVTSSLEPLWLARSRPGGLKASVERLAALRPRLV